MADWTEDEKRRTILFEPKHAFEEGSQFTVDGDKLIVSVSDEQAVDSYNQSFTCTHTMTREQAVKLRDWLAYNI
jgi:hypothetical protein